ncbi:DUF4365 domain-containing protein [Pasteurella multocida]|uniref:DUF4365 domain-containing protein n=1 Tax=Pasteurella multocida TaxID=747 RepID=UPI001897E63C|nr:DUF4365 domain-containing protein [Pasteurella multocida]MBF6981602.1 DUF4365 domain-containing protein [Pasteurella multocida]MDA5611798.1 DUF4365 domain-containing protein [Pasteurella multocida]MDA5614268.1 DUF4365 domain-containing protein [Pasteurella multocida]MDA5620640.1 DUF4365 domain-containing protein [Pasteurella multocida subsp. multocida]
MTEEKSKIDVDYDYAEQYQKAYVKMLAARCRMMITEGSQPDRESIDMSISLNKYNPTLGYSESGEIKLQLKTDFQHNLSADKKSLKYSLPIKNYRDLIGSRRAAPRYLFVMPLPIQEHLWVHEMNNGAFISGVCYWVNLTHYPPTTNKTKVTIDIPLTQIVTLEVLKKMLYKAIEGKIL